MPLTGKVIFGLTTGAAALLLAVVANATAPAPTPRPPAAGTAPATSTPAPRPPTTGTAPATSTPVPRPPTTGTAPATAPPAVARPPATAPSLSPPTATPPATAAPLTVRPPASAPAQATAPPAINPVEISEAKLALAKQVVKNVPALGNFDGILPDLMFDTQTRLINVRPDLYKQIAAVVEATASALVARRTDLDNDIARAWARSFSEDELRAINAFFVSPAGAKYKALAPQVGQDIIQAGQNWTDRLAGEMYDRALAELRRQGHAL